MDNVSVTVDQNTKDLLENRHRLIREMATSIAVNGEDDTQLGNENRSLILKLHNWNTWCKETRGFADGATVTEDKICLFLQEYVVMRIQKSQKFLQKQSDSQQQPQQPQQQPQSQQHPQSSAVSNTVGQGQQQSQSEQDDQNQMTESSFTCSINTIEKYALVKSYVTLLLDQYQHQRRSGLNSHPYPCGILLRGYLQRLKNAATSAKRRRGHQFSGLNSRSHRRVFMSEIGDRSSVPALSSDESDSDELDCFSDDGLLRGTDYLGNQMNIQPSGSISTSGGIHKENRSQLMSFSTATTRLENMLRTAVDSLRDNMQHLLSLHSDKVMQSIARESSEHKALLERQMKSFSLLTIMMEKIILWAGEDAPDLANEIIPIYRTLLATSGNSNNTSNVGNQSIFSQLNNQLTGTPITPTSSTGIPATVPSSSGPISVGQQHDSATVTSNFLDSSSILSAGSDGTSDPSVPFSNGGLPTPQSTDEANLFKAAMAVVNQRHPHPQSHQQHQPSSAQQQQQQQQVARQSQQQPPQQQIPPPPQQQQQTLPEQHQSPTLQSNHNHPQVSHMETQSHLLHQAAKRQNKALTHAQQHHLQNQHVTDPYILSSPLSTSNGTFSSSGLIDNSDSPYKGATVPQYRMSRDISTVPDLWEEWEHGLNGGPIVRELEEKYGTRWRQNSAERKFFCLRKVIIDYIMKLCQQDGVSIEEAVGRVEEMRKVNQFTSLQRLAEHIKKIRKIS
ncbi:transcriptional activator of glycolytic enzymes-domain-containing protein [Dipodascopsis uninucleata]